MDRRGFIQRTFGALAAIVAAPFVPTPPVRQGLMFHRDVFAVVMAPVGEYETVPIDITEPFGFDIAWASFDRTVRLDRAQYRLSSSRLPA